MTFPVLMRRHNTSFPPICTSGKVLTPLSNAIFLLSLRPHSKTVSFYISNGEFKTAFSNFIAPSLVIHSQILLLPFLSSMSWNKRLLGKSLSPFLEVFKRCVDVHLGHGLVADFTVLGLQLALMILRVFSNLIDSVIL